MVKNEDEELDKLLSEIDKLFSDQFFAATESRNDIRRQNIKKAVIRAKREVYEDFNQWLYDQSVGVGTIQDWAEDRLQQLKDQSKEGQS